MRAFLPPTIGGLATVLLLIAFSASSAVAGDDVPEENTIDATEVERRYVPSSHAVVELEYEQLSVFLMDHPLAIVAVYSPTCGACMGFMPEFDSAADRIAAAVKAGEMLDTGLAFVRINGVDASADWISEHRVSGFPTVLLFAAGRMSRKTLHEHAKTADEIVTFAQRFNSFMSVGDKGAIATQSQLNEIVRDVVMTQRKTLLLTQFTYATAPPTADPGDAPSPCRIAFAAGMTELLSLDFLDVQTTRIDGVSAAASELIETDIGLDGWKGAHPDHATECTIHGVVTILRCASAQPTGPCRVVGAALPIPSSAEEVARLIIAHGVPEGLELTVKNDVLTNLLLDRSIPQSSNGLHPRRLGRRSRPTLVYFGELKACEPDTPEYKYAKYLKRSIRAVAQEYLNMTFLVADQYQFSTLYLRLGFKRPHAKDGIVFGIYDEGLRYSALEMNYTSFSLDNVRDFVNRFNRRELTPFMVSQKYSSKTGGIKVVGQISARGLYDKLWRIGDPIPNPRPVGGVEDIVLLTVAHKHCMLCREIIDEWEALVSARNSMGDNGVINAVPTEFLEVKDGDSVKSELRSDLSKVPQLNTGARTSLNTLAAVMNAQTAEAAAKRRMLERISPFFLNGTNNYPPTEAWQRLLTSNSNPIIGAAARVSRVAFDQSGAAQWEVTLHNPRFLDFTTNKFHVKKLTALDYIDLAQDVWDEHVGYGQAVVRGGDRL